MPDAPGWKIPILTDGESGFHNWRETFGNMVGSFRLQLDLVLAAIRDEKAILDDDQFTQLFMSTTHFEKPMDVHAAEWAFAFVSRRLSALVDANPEGGTKIFKEVKDTNGLEVYRLLNVNYNHELRHRVRVAAGHPRHDALDPQGPCADGGHAPRIFHKGRDA